MEAEVARRARAHTKIQNTSRIFIKKHAHHQTNQTPKKKKKTKKKFFIRASRASEREL